MMLLLLSYEAPGIGSSISWVKCRNIERTVGNIGGLCTTVNYAVALSDPRCAGVLLYL